MQVLVIPTWYPSGEDKLMGLYHKEYTSALNKNGIKADMLFIERERLSKPFKYLFLKKKYIEEADNFKVYKYRMLNLRPINFDLQMKAYTKVLEKAFKDYLKYNPKPDLIHAEVTVPAGYAASVLGKKYNIPVVVTEHGSNFEKYFKEEPFKKYSEYTLKNSTFSTVSNYMRDIVMKYTGECYVIPNQVNTDIFKTYKARKVNKTFNLIMVCALREGKRLDIAFKAIKILLKEHIRIHLNIIGDGFYENIFKKAMVDEGVEKNVTFLGRKEKDEIPPYLMESHALLIGSEIETFAIPGIEALASGIPVITTDCYGPVEFVDKKCGAICKVNDPEDMARAIKEVITNYEKYDKKYLESVAERYSEEEVIKVAKDVYKIAIYKVKKENEK